MTDDFKFRSFEQTPFDNGHMGNWCRDCCREVKSLFAVDHLGHEVQWERIYNAKLIWQGEYKPTNPPANFEKVWKMKPPCCDCTVIPPSPDGGVDVSKCKNAYWQCLGTETIRGEVCFCRCHLRIPLND